MKTIGALLSLALILFLPARVPAQEKSHYDVTAPSAAITEIMANIHGSAAWRGTVTRSVGEVALMSGGFFTIGTTGGTLSGNGASAGLDDRCGVTFGHPYARTSYPVICVDGTWKKPLAFFSPDSERIVGQGDSVAMVYTAAGIAQLTLTYALALDGGVCVIRSELRNLDSVAHMFGSGFAFDPGLGKAGDGSLYAGNILVMNDTVLATPAPGSIVIHERATSPYGMSIGVDFPDGVPDEIIAANWKDRAVIDGPTRPTPEVGRLYDLDLFSWWHETPTPPGGTCKHSMRVQLHVGSFGSGVFLRWDLPDHGQITDGVMVPSSVPTTATATNLSGATVSGTITFLGEPGITFGTSSSDVSVVNGVPAYIHSRATFEEWYQSSVVRAMAVFSGSGGIKDTVIRSYLIPATPVTDTGLTVTIDSVVAGASPAVAGYFTVKQTATGQYQTGLTAKNVVVTDNGTRITPTTVRRDTSGSASGIDIVFVLDVTGSMTAEINDVKNTIMAFADSMTGRGMAYRFGLVTFLDAVESVYPFTQSASTFKGYVSAQFAHGGDDAPENSLEALDTARTYPWNPSSRHVIIWITDITYHEADQFTPKTRQQVIGRLLEKNITVYAIGAPDYQLDWYDPIINATGGKFYSYLGRYLDILVDIAMSRMSTRMVVEYAAPGTGGGSHDLAITVHFAGRGGTGTTTYVRPGLAVRAPGISTFPNPFNPTTTIRVSGPSDVPVDLVLYDFLGREVRHVQFPPGEEVRTFVWDARDAGGQLVATGVYFARAIVGAGAAGGSTTATIKILHLK